MPNRALQYAQIVQQDNIRRRRNHRHVWTALLGFIPHKLDLLHVKIAMLVEFRLKERTRARIALQERTPIRLVQASVYYVKLEATMMDPDTRTALNVPTE